MQLEQGEQVSRERATTTHLHDVDDGVCDAGAVLLCAERVLDVGRVAVGEHADARRRLSDVKLPHEASNKPQLFGKVPGPDPLRSVDQEDDVG